jgi:hypothetical protein
VSSDIASDAATAVDDEDSDSLYDGKAYSDVTGTLAEQAHRLRSFIVARTTQGRRAVLGAPPLLLVMRQPLHRN